MLWQTIIGDDSLNLAIMQPYLFPYIGYFQLLKACDHFVVYDDVQFIKSGWINRNRLLSNGQPTYFNFRINKGSTFDKINEKTFVPQIAMDKDKFRKSLQSMYGKAPYFQDAYKVIDEIISLDEMNVSRFVAHTIEALTEWLGLEKTFHISSELGIPGDIHAQERVLWVNAALGADRYINVIGGQELYDVKTFAEHGVELKFLQPKLREYPQFKGEFVPGLSIVDVMMFNPKEEILRMLDEYELV